MKNISNFQDCLKKSIKRFDLCSLIKLLGENDYGLKDIYFKSNPELSSHSSLCEAIEFAEESPRVILTVNFGLLSHNSPLPSFFKRKMDTGSIDPHRFSRYLSFFDHHLIKNLVLMCAPEINKSLISDWREIQNYYLKLLDFQSIGTLWYLFQLCFPELIVKVVKFPKLFKEEGFSSALGKITLGPETYLGKKIEQSTPSFKFTLIGEEAETYEGTPWPFEVRHRLKHTLFALFERTPIHFRISLIIKNSGSAATLSKRSYLGFCGVGQTEIPLKLILFSGYSKDLGKL